MVCDANHERAAGNLFLIPFGVNLAGARPAWQPVQAVTAQDSVNAGIRNFDVVISRKIPHDPNRPQVVFSPKMQNLFFDLWRRSVGMPFGNGLAVYQASLALRFISSSPSVETGAADAEISAGLYDGTIGLGVTKNSKFATNVALITGHQTDPPSPNRRLKKMSREYANIYSLYLSDRNHSIHPALLTADRFGCVVNDPVGMDAVILAPPLMLFIGVIDVQAERGLVV